LAHGRDRRFRCRSSQHRGRAGLEMRNHAVAAQHVGVHRRHAPARVLTTIADRFLALPMGVAIALVWANTAPEPYFRMAQSLAFAVNDIGMAFFVRLIMQADVRAAMPHGAL